MASKTKTAETSHKLAGPAPSADSRNSGAANPFSGLQRTLGNQAMMRLLESGMVQAKLRVSQPEDPAEMEAERVADAVAGPSIQRSKASTRMEPDTMAQETITSSLGPGQSLEPKVRSFMESRLGHDFADVRVHSDEKAAESARSIHARAFTLGRDLVFDTQTYAPDTDDGKRLLAHELTHVIQQGAARPKGEAPGNGLAAKSSVSRTIQRQGQQQPTGQGGSGTQGGTAPAQLTQNLYNQAIAVLAGIPTVNPIALRILRQGQVGAVAHRVQVNASTQSAPGTAPGAGQAAGAQATGPQITVVFDLDISTSQSGLPPGAFARFVEDPATLTTITGTAQAGFTFTRILRILTKAPTGPNAANVLAEALLHEGNHMLLGMDRLLQQNLGILPNDPSLTAALSGKLASFGRYQQAGRQSSQRAPLIAALVAELNRVVAPGQSGAGGASSANSLAAEAIDTMLEERFVFDQQRAQMPHSRAVSNAEVARAYVPVGLASATGNMTWPSIPQPQRTNLESLATAFLDDVQQILNPPAAPPPSTGSSQRTAPPPAASGSSSGSGTAPRRP